MRGETESAPPELLEVRNLRAGYGARAEAVLDGLSFSLGHGEAVTVLGPNGAGKTTLLRAISSVIEPRSGDIRFQGHPIHRQQSYDVARRGLGHVPEGRGIFPGLTVAENLALGTFATRDRHPPDEAAARASVIDLFPWLSNRLTQLAGTLSGGEQQMLAIGRALMGRPRLLLLDEPSLGLSPIMAEHVFAALRDIRDSGVALLLVEQNLSYALGLAERGYVMNRGRFVLEGSARELARADVFGAYVAAP